MSNVHGLYSGKNKKKNDDDDSQDDSNNRFVGGIGDHGGGSGLAVVPNMMDGPPVAAAGGANPDSIFQIADNATSDEQGEVRRTITMYRDGFVVDDGPYRRLDDPANASFLRSLAMGRTPQELMSESPDGNVVVGLVDKRGEDYVEEFRSFSGQGTSLGSTAAVSEGDTTVFDPASLPTPPAAADGATTPIQVRLANGQRRVVRLPLTATVQDLAANVAQGTGDVDGRFQLLFGFPPKPLDGKSTIQDAGLKGASVSLKKV